MHARPPSLDECVIKSARIEAEARHQLAKLQFTRDYMIKLIESSANAISASQALLAELQRYENSN
jgi:hypothetical protein